MFSAFTIGELIFNKATHTYLTSLHTQKPLIDSVISYKQLLSKSSLSQLSVISVVEHEP